MTSEEKSLILESLMRSEIYYKKLSEADYLGRDIVQKLKLINSVKNKLKEI